MKTIWMYLIVVGFSALIGSTAQAQVGIGISVPGVRIYNGFGAYPGYPAYGYPPYAPPPGYGYHPYPVYPTYAQPPPVVGGYYGGYGYGPRYYGVYHGGHGYYHR